MLKLDMQQLQVPFALSVSAHFALKTASYRRIKQQGGSFISSAFANASSISLQLSSSRTTPPCIAINALLCWSRLLVLAEYHIKCP